MGGPPLPHRLDQATEAWRKVTSKWGVALVFALLLAFMTGKAGLGVGSLAAATPDPESTASSASRSLGNLEDAKYRDVIPGRVEVCIEGLLRLVGTSRFPRLLVAPARGEPCWLPSRKAIPSAWMALVGRRVEAFGWLEDHELRQANGRVLGIERVMHARMIREAGH